MKLPIISSTNSTRATSRPTASKVSSASATTPLTDRFTSIVGSALPSDAASTLLAAKVQENGESSARPAGPMVLAFGSSGGSSSGGGRGVSSSSGSSGYRGTTGSSSSTNAGIIAAGALLGSGDSGSSGGSSISAGEFFKLAGLYFVAPVAGVGLLVGACMLCAAKRKEQRSQSHG